MTLAEPTLRLTRDSELRRRAAKVIPGGMFGHMNVARLPPGFRSISVAPAAAGCGTSTATNTST
jgi:hypothetical protein